MYPHKRIKIPAILKIGDGKLSRLGHYLKNHYLTKAVCFLSKGIEEIVLPDLENSLEGQGIHLVKLGVVEDISLDQVIKSATGLPKNINVILGVGGGKALDFSKYCAHLLTIPFVSVPTSLSNDGFCSPVASLEIDSKRATLNATIPYGVVIDTKIVETSPDSLLYSGIGDLISKVTAGYDWQEASERGNERLDDFSYLISQNTVRDIFEHHYESIRSGKFIYDLANALMMNGISMEIAGSSRPASGSEHLICHAYERISVTPSLHGIQVGVSTYLCSYLQCNQFEQVEQFLDNTGFIDYVSKNPLNKDEYQQALKIAPTVKEDFYSILSHADKISEGLAFIEENAVMQRMLR